MKGFLTWLTRVESLFAASAYAIVTVLLFGEIIAREVFATSIEGSLKMAVFAAIVAGFLGMSLATASGSHLRPQFADGWLPGAWAPVVVRIGDALSAVLFAGFGSVAALYVYESYQLDERAAVLYWPLWPLQSVIPLAFFTSAIRHLAFAIWPGLKPVPSSPE